MYHGLWALWAMCISPTAEKILQAQVSASTNEEWVPAASNRNPPNNLNWCHRWVTVSPKSKQGFFGRAGAKKCLGQKIESSTHLEEAKWQVISWNHGKISAKSQSRNSPDSHGNWSTTQKAMKRNLEQRYSFNEAQLECKLSTRQKLRWRPPVDRLLKRPVIKDQHLSHWQ